MISINIRNNIGHSRGLSADESIDRIYSITNFYRQAQIPNYSEINIGAEKSLVPPFVTGAVVQREDAQFVAQEQLNFVSDPVRWLR
jgi:hypothetical protein